ncbi:hypothetical protein PBY51_017293 [Eleginops maclovinus]|uniref:Uncharacterized protein n=1 Tax=Eleginops maclovinus TaxID=56733 RepID=A0AAN7XJF8_ELEMC|nr:hypothetical protein PBY51_017293 [Eleginops maclovinus]
MDKAVIHFIILGVISGLTEGAGNTRLEVYDRVSEGLSADAIAGIVVSLIVVVFAGGAAGFYVYKSKKPQQSSEEVRNNSDDETHSDNKDPEECIYENTSAIYQNI